MKPEIALVMVIFCTFTVLEIIFTKFFAKSGQRRKDVVVEVISLVILFGLTQPLVLLASNYLMGVTAPNLENAWVGMAFVPAFGLFLLFDDLTQYLWHRLSHSIPWLYHLHRPHHDAPYMSVRLVYRNNLFYYAFMPSIWLSGVLVYLGLGQVYAVYIVAKLLVISGAHSDVRWDEPLYKIKWLAPVMWVVERLISTPSTHSAHHGKHKADGITNYKGNYGNFLFLWDVILGTAKITRKYPPATGVEGLEEVSSGEQLLWPLIRDKHTTAAE